MIDLSEVERYLLPEAENQRIFSEQIVPQPPGRTHTA